MRALVGDDALWKPLPSFLTPGTPLSSNPLCLAIFGFGTNFGRRGAKAPAE